MGRRGAGRRLNDQERMEILDTLARETKVKNVDLAKRYGVSEGAIRKLKQIKDTIRSRYQMGNEQNRDKRKRGAFVRNAQFEQELYEWIAHVRETSAYQLVPLTQTAVRQQAILLAKKYDSMGSFKASPGWFARYCSRHRLDPPMHQNVIAGIGTTGVGAADTTMAVGDSIPGGPLASAYQVEPMEVSPADTTVAAITPAAPVTKVDVAVSVSATPTPATAETTTTTAVTVSVTAEITEPTEVAPTPAASTMVDSCIEPSSADDLKCSEAMDEHIVMAAAEADKINASVAEAAMNLAPAVATVAAAPALNVVSMSVSAPTDDEIFSLGL